MYLHTRQHCGHKSIVCGEDDREQPKSKQLFRKQVSQYVRLPGNTGSTRPRIRMVDTRQPRVEWTLESDLAAIVDRDLRLVKAERRWLLADNRLTWTTVTASYTSSRKSQ